MKLALYFKADLENVTDLVPAEDYEWHFKIECGSCHEVDENWISFNRQDEYDMSNSRGQANLVMRCKFCKRESTAQFDPSSKVTSYTDSGKFQKLAVFDVRGLELVDFAPRDTWLAKGTETDTRFDDIDLLEGEWADYDETAGEPVGITNIEVQFKKEK
ncbi:uncharacterized protein BX664DRAFT_295708 [Halteromyces radiatus]|uniref:uncharacterized protein n=1 Tax=Halteromyces radiatus TaxID=101107 RepID=UPI0022202857|nr:uncharacterized protein BX664DRAFT_295708 [Halteromyces radiatus]KAI8093801.1 hypothetical protein BX664DRAFT_295708 [Halteromyces radiatus]